MDPVKEAFMVVEIVVFILSCMITVSSVTDSLHEPNKSSHPWWFYVLVFISSHVALWVLLFFIACFVEWMKQPF